MHYHPAPAFPLKLAAVRRLAAMLTLVGFVNGVSAQTVTYEQNANGQYLDTSTDGDMHYEPTDNDWSQQTTYGTGRDGNMFLASVSNWSTPTYPDSASVAVSIDLPVTLDVTTTVGTLTLGSGGSVATLSGITLTIADGVMMNDGTFTVRDNPYNSSLTFSADATISGGGSIILDETDGGAQIATTGSAVVTQMAGHTINGFGHINASLVNNGVVDSNAPDGSTLATINLGAYAMTNNGTMQADAGDSLSLEQTTLTQSASGQLLANGGQINFDSASVTGGQINGTTTGMVRGGGVTLTNVTNNTVLSVNYYTINGTLTDNGTVNVLGNPYNGTLTLADGATLAGTGAVTMTQGGYSFIATASGATATQAAGHTINGAGNIDATLVNNGTISGSGGITFQNGSALTNNALVTTTSNGGIQTNGVPITQGPNGQLVANGSTFRLTGGGNSQLTTITGGTLNSAGGGVFVIDNTSLTNVTNNATLNVGNPIIDGTLTNNGTINIQGNPNQADLDFTAGSSLTGTGSIFAMQGGYSLMSVDSDVTLQVSGGQVIATNISGSVTFNGSTLQAGGGVNGYDELQNGTYTNAGVFEALDGGTINLDGSATLTNYNATTQTLKGGTYEAISTGDGTNLNLNIGTVAVNAATVVLSGQSASFTPVSGLTDNQGSFSVLGLKQFSNAAALSNEGTITLDAGSTFHVSGAYTSSGSKAALDVVIGGTASQGAMSPGILQVNGAATLAGKLNLYFSTGAALPPASATLTIVSATSAIGGSFSNVASGARLTTTDGRGSFLVSYGPGSATPSAVVLSAFVSDGGPSITSAPKATATVGQAFSYTITATESPTSFGVQGLPSGFTVNTTTGVISATPKAAGTITLTLNAYNSKGKGSETLTLTVANGTPVITSAATATATQGKAFSYQITASNSPTSFGVQGLPAGLTVNTKTGLISGTVSGAGKVTLTLNAYNASGKGSATLTLTVSAAPPVITSATTATATAGKAFSYQITASNQPTSFGVQGLPSGFTVNTTTGVISATPKAAGKINLTLNAYNAAGKGSATLTLTITQ